METISLETDGHGVTRSGPFETTAPNVSTVASILGATRGHGRPNDGWPICRSHLSRMRVDLDQCICLTPPQAPPPSVVGLQPHQFAP